MVTKAKGASLQLDDDLASTANGLGASLIGVEDAADNFTASDLEAILIELAAASVGTLLRVKGADLTTASVVAGALTFGTDGDNYDFTGTDEITSIATVGIGTIKRVHFDDVATITHHASNLICQGGLSFKTEAGGMALFYEYAVGNWRVYYFPYAKAIDTNHDHAYANITTDWAVATVYVVGDKRKPTSPDGRLYAEVTTAGTSHASTEPTWPIRAGDTVSDNDTVWTMRDGGGELVGTDSIEDAAITQSKLNTTAVVSLAGAINTTTFVSVVLTHYCFFPMIHTAQIGSSQPLLSGHSADGASADAPRLGFYNIDITDSATYDVDYRYIGA